MGLLDLPIEILRQICEVFCPHCTAPPYATPHRSSYDYAAQAGPLANLSLTCLVLRDLAQPILYHDVMPHSLFRLLRTLVANPQLAAHIRGLDNEHSDDGRRPGPDDLPAIEAAARRMGVALPAGWTKESWEHGDGVMYRMMELVLALVAPSLEALRYVQHMDGDLGDLLALGDESRCAVAFPRLRRLWLGHYDTEGGMDLGGDGMALFLAAAPMLEDLTVYMCGGVDAGLSLGNVRKLDFACSYLEAEDLARAVEACPKLESFEYYSGGAIISDSVQEFLPGDAWRALCTRAGTLRHLDLEFGCYAEMLDHDLAPHEQMGSLAQFQRLESLIVPPSLCLLRPGREDVSDFHNSAELVQMLPQSVCVLSLPASRHTYLYGAPIQLVEAKRRGGFPNLTTVGLVARQSEMERIVAAFAEVGVQCKPYSEI